MLQNHFKETMIKSLWQLQWQASLRRQQLGTSQEQEQKQGQGQVQGQVPKFWQTWPSGSGLQEASSQNCPL